MRRSSPSGPETGGRRSPPGRTDRLRPGSASSAARRSPAAGANHLLLRNNPVNSGSSASGTFRLSPATPGIEARQGGTGPAAGAEARPSAPNPASLHTPLPSNDRAGQERILVPSVGPGEWGRRRPPLSVQAVHALVAHRREPGQDRPPPWHRHAGLIASNAAAVRQGTVLATKSAMNRCERSHRAPRSRAGCEECDNRGQRSRRAPGRPRWLRKARLLRPTQPPCVRKPFWLRRVR